MTSISLPLGRGARLSGPAFILCLSGLVLFCQTALHWRLAVAGSIVVLGALLWSHNLRRRPVSLVIEAHGGVSCVLADGREFQVKRILPGIVRPWLLCGRLEGGAGESCDLFVPGGQPSVGAHWQLRRALTGFRVPQSQDRRGV